MTQRAVHILPISAGAEEGARPVPAKRIRVPEDPVEFVPALLQAAISSVAWKGIRRDPVLTPCIVLLQQKWQVYSEYDNPSGNLWVPRCPHLPFNKTYTLRAYGLQANFNVGHGERADVIEVDALRVHYGSH